MTNSVYLYNHQYERFVCVLKCIFMLFQNKTMRLASQRQAKPGKHVTQCPHTHTHTHTLVRVLTHSCVSIRSAKDGGVCGLLRSPSSAAGVRSAAAAVCGRRGGADARRSRPAVVGGEGSSLARTHTHTHTHTHTITHTHTYTLTHTLIRTHAHTLTQSLTYTLTRTHTHTHSNKLIHTHTHTHTHTQTNTHSLTHTHTHTHTYTHSLTHTHTHTHTHSWLRHFSTFMKSACSDPSGWMSGEFLPRTEPYCQTNLYATCREKNNNIIMQVLCWLTGENSACF